MAKDESLGFFEKAWLFLTDADYYHESMGPGSGNRGPVGFRTNSPRIDKSTLSRSQSRPPGVQGVHVTLGPIELAPIASDEVKLADSFERKFEVGEDVYWELGLAGQIAEKFLSLPYRKGGLIKFKSGKLKGKGLVCTSFAKIFGALWFTGDPKRQEKLGSRFPAAVYAEEYGGSIVNDKRLRLRTLVSMLDKHRDRLYAVVTYRTRAGDSRQHVWFLIFSNSLDAWVRIESTGWALKTGGKGPGPGIYRLRYTKRAKKNFYQAWDWGPAYRPRDPDINQWDYTGHP